MNTWGYLLLIAALLSLAALMLYARFHPRSREKSPHHGLDGIFLSGTETKPSVENAWDTSAKPGAPVPLEADVSEAPEYGHPAVEAMAEIPVVRAEPLRQREVESGSEPDPESDYMDELQEAAAGLAKLMRSSPLPRRSDPVVFAPSEETVEDLLEEPIEEALEDSVAEAPEEPVAETLVETHEEPAAETPEAAIEFEDTWEPAVEVTDEVPPAAEGLSRDEANGAGNVETLEQLLGDTVCEELQRIDSGLDALEDLVLEIEGSLSNWATDGLGVGTLEEGFAVESFVGVAA